MKLNLISFLIPILFLFSCGEKRQGTDTQISLAEGKQVNLKYAKGFSIREFEGFKLIEIINPWQGAKNIKLEYLLYHNEIPDENIFPDAIRIKTPINKIVCMSTTHIGFLDALDEMNSIIGIANKKLVFNDKLSSRIYNNEIVDVGYDKNLNYEQLLSIQPDIIMSYSVGSELAGVSSKLKELNLSMVLNAEYLESHPLGKAEWIKFIAAFYDKKEIAIDLFDNIEKEYLRLTEITLDFKTKPTIMTGLPWKGTWYVSGGESYSAKLIRDAGGEFIWKDNTSHEALGLTIETVFNKAGKADIWINSGYANSYTELLKTDERIALFDSFDEKKVFNNNKLTNESGGNDYWESGIVNPHIILKDLINIFHPGVIADSSLYYYQRL